MKRDGDRSKAMTDKDERTAVAGTPEETGQRRREERYKVPEGCLKYIKLTVKNGDEFTPAILGNFSRSGILFECLVPFKKGDHAEFHLSISLVLEREISFGCEIRYCYEDSGSYLMGASIDSISDEQWFDVFVDTYDFIVSRQGCSKQ
jgi:PilZ domain